MDILYQSNIFGFLKKISIFDKRYLLKRADTEEGEIK